MIKLLCVLLLKFILLSENFLTLKFVLESIYGLYENKLTGVNLNLCFSSVLYFYLICLWLAAVQANFHNCFQKPMYSEFFST